MVRELINFKMGDRVILRWVAWNRLAKRVLACDASISCSLYDSVTPAPDVVAAIRREAADGGVIRPEVREGVVQVVLTIDGVTTVAVRHDGMPSFNVVWHDSSLILRLPLDDSIENDLVDVANSVGLFTESDDEFKLRRRHDRQLALDHK